MKKIILGVLMLSWLLNGQNATIVWKSPVILGRVSAVAVNGQGIYICDRKQFSIFHLDKNGQLIKRFGGRGEGPGEFRSLSDMALTDTTIYINDFYSIKQFDLDGRFLSHIDLSKIGRFPRMQVCSKGFIFLGAPPQGTDDNAVLFMKSFEKADYDMFHLLPFGKDTIQGFGGTLPGLKGQQAPVHLRNFYNIAYVVQDPYIYYVDNIEYGIWRTRPGESTPRLMIKEEIPYFIPYRCEIEIQQNQSNTITTTKKMDKTLFRLFPTQHGFFVYLSNEKASRLRDYRFKDDRLAFAREIQEFPADNVLAYSDGIFYGLAEDTFLAFRLD